MPTPRRADFFLPSSRSPPWPSANPLPDPKNTAQLESLPVQNPKAAGIDVGDKSHWVAVHSTPDGSDTKSPLAHEPQDHNCPRRSHWRHRPVDHPRHPGRRARPKLAKLRDRRCKKSEAEIAKALDGRYRDEHLSELRSSLRLWEAYQETIGLLDGEIEAHLQKMRKESQLPPLKAKKRVRGRKPHDPKFNVREALYYATGVDLTAIEGIDEIHALTLISELGTDMTKWPTVGQFASWLGLCPQFKKTGGKVQSSATRKGKNRAAQALRLAAWGLMRSTSYLGAYLRRQWGRLGAPKAITATVHKLARIIYNLLRYGAEYVKRDEEAYAEQVRERLEKQLHRQARELGYELVKKQPEAPAATPESEDQLSV